MPKSSSIAAILVGGRETRHLRVPKQTLPFGDTTVVGRTLQAYLDAGFEQIIVVLGYKADLVVEALGKLPPKVKVLKNPLFDEGVASFLRVGVRELPASAGSFCLGLLDQPLLTSELLEEFTKAFVEAGKKILVPVYQSSLGLPAFFDKSLVSEMESLPGRGELWDILKKHQNDLVDHPTGYTAVVRSIDDLDDYHAMLEIAGLPIPEDLPIHVPEQEKPEEEEPIGEAAVETASEGAPTTEPVAKDEAVDDAPERDSEAVTENAPDQTEEKKDAGEA